MTIFLFSMLILALATLGAQIVAYNAYKSKKGLHGQSHGRRIHAAVAAN